MKVVSNRKCSGKEASKVPNHVCSWRTSECLAYQLVPLRSPGSVLQFCLLPFRRLKLQQIPLTHTQNLRYNPPKSETTVPPEALWSLSMSPLLEKQLWWQDKRARCREGRRRTGLAHAGVQRFCSPYWHPAGKHNSSKSDTDRCCGSSGHPSQIISWSLLWASKATTDTSFSTDNA